MRASWLLLLLAISAACTTHKSEGGAAPGKVAAVVDGGPIRYGAFVEALVAAQGDSFFPRYVERVLAEREAKAAGVTVSEGEVSKAVDKEIAETIAGRFGGKREALEKQLGEYGLTYDAWRRQRRIDKRVELLARKLLKQRVDDTQVRALFERRYGKDGVRRRLRHILISTHVSNTRFYTRAEYDDEKPAIERTARKAAAGLRRELVAGADMAALAKTRSDDHSARRGGDLGSAWSGRFGKTFDAAVRKLSVGQISPVVQGRRGFHVIRVYGLRKGARYKGAHILVSARASGPDDKRDEAARFAAARAEAEALRESLQSGGDLATVAREKSADPTSRGRGGDLGEFRPGRLGGEVDPVLETLPLEQVSEPIRVSSGYELVRLDTRELRPAEDKKLVRHILISTEYFKVKARRLAGKLEAMAEARAKELDAKLRQPDADFAQLARDYSEDELTRRSGGEYANYRPGALGPKIDAALAQMKPGDVRVVRSKRGLHVLELLGVTKTDYEKVRAELAAEIKGKPVSGGEIKRFLAGLREKAKIEKRF